ncbi:PadR family transcriptional regulator [Methylobacterium longum]|uniref:PadR family transcriptional regulator n=1 Tax=Methylobacterium longum TaxID=767694 RepID=A0ABT8AQG2_9HYPH|nr:PadR family transcriptional regulator [Methylobacterium longum]MDN3571796.1 PadR family transcriptional regulator [Methylobacterium longum]GJE13997.1 hypothetical protein FOHLNKBM_5066 [Methylobacterium longum]
MAVSRPSAQILSYLATAPVADTSGAAISKATGIGAIYPELAALENGGLIVGAWEEGKSPRRRLYRLTAAGRQQVGAMSPLQEQPRSSAGNWFWSRFVAPFFGG